jgi:hypothetical protein
MSLAPKPTLENVVPPAARKPAVTFIERGKFTGVVLDGKPAGRFYALANGFRAHTNARGPGADSYLGTFSVRQDAIAAIAEAKS